MKTISIIAMAMFLTSGAPQSNFSADNSTIVRSEMKIDRIVDYTNPDNPIVCYMAQHHNGSSHTTPAIFCLKMYGR
jgi:hypothetical protein